MRTVVSLCCMITSFYLPLRPPPVRLPHFLPGAGGARQQGAPRPPGLSAPTCAGPLNYLPRPPSAPLSVFQLHLQHIFTKMAQHLHSLHRSTISKFCHNYNTVVLNLPAALLTIILIWVA